MTSDTPFQQLLRALARFWWVALLGIVLAAAAFVFATYKVALGMPPKLTSRTQPSYSASTQLLITSKRDPYLSAGNVNARIVTYPTSTGGKAAGGSAAGAQQAYTYDSSGGADGDLQRLVEIANDLPPRVTSDPVIELRNSEFRRINGTVSASNPYAFSGAGGFREGPLPYIQINGTAHTPKDALDITNDTALAFKSWFTQQQAATGIKVADRVLVEQVNSASQAFPASGKKPILGLAAALLVLLGAGGFALALERLIPRRKPLAQRAAAPAPEAFDAPLPAAPATAQPAIAFAAGSEQRAEAAEAPKSAQRPRKSGNNGARRRPRTRPTASSVAPHGEDAG